MKRFFIPLILLILGILPLRAQIGTPNEFDAFFNLDFYRYTSLQRNVTISLNGETILNNKSIGSSGFDVSSFTRSIKPGVVYPLVITRGPNLKYGIGISVPDGYVAEINGKIGNTFFEGVETTSTESITYLVTIRSLAVMQSETVLGVGEASPMRISDIGWEVGLGKTWNGNGAGFIHLGANAINGETLKRAALGIHIPPFQPGEFNPIYQDLDGNGIAESIRQIRAPQCLVDFVDVTDSGGNPNGYEIRFYNSGVLNGGTGLYDPVGAALVTYAVNKGSSTTSLKITKTDASGTITSEASSVPDGALKDWELTVTGSGYVKKTSVNNSAITNGRQEDITISYQTAPSSLPAQASKSFSLRRTYRNIATSGTINIREKISSIVYNIGQPDARTERYTYWDSDPSGSDFGRLKFKEDPFGEWKLFAYHDIFITGGSEAVVNDFVQWSKNNRVFGTVGALIPMQGRLFQTISSESDSFGFNIDTSTANDVVTAFQSGQCVGVSHSMGYAWDEFNAIPVRTSQDYVLASATKSIGRDFTSPLTFPLDYNPSGLSSNFIEMNRRYSTPNKAAYNGEDDKAIAWSMRYVPYPGGATLDNRLAFKPYMSVTADDIKRVHGYAQAASYGGVSDAWVEVDIQGRQAQEIIDNTVGRIVSVTSEATGQTFNGNFSQALYTETLGILLDRCKTSDGKPFKSGIYADALTRYVNPVTTTHNGISMRMDSVQLVPGKSDKVVRVFNRRGELKQEERWVYDLGASWRLVETINHGYDALSHLVLTTRTDGSSNATRTLYEASYTGLMMDWQNDARGIRTDFTYDGLGRLASSTVSSGHGGDGIPASIGTTVLHDAMDHVVEQRTGELRESSEYDSMGLVISETNSNGLTTTYAYTREAGAGKKVTTTFPDGGTEIKIYQRNGRIKSVTGTAVVAKYHTYSYDLGVSNETGNLDVRIDIGLPASNVTKHPFSITRVDWGGRTVREESASPLTQNFIRTYQYDSTNRRRLGTTETEVSLTGGSVTQSLVINESLDEFGNVLLKGTDVDGSGLSLGSTDRIAKTETVYVLNGGAVIERKTDTYFPVNGAATGVTVITDTKISGLASGTVSELSLKDTNGNTTQIATAVDRATGTVTTVTTHQDTSTESSVSVMGLPKVSNSRQGLVTKRSYDTNGRVLLEITKTQERSHSTKNIYEPLKSRLASVTTGLDEAGAGSGYTTSYAYDSGGRVSSITYPNGTVGNTAYNFRGQVIKVWGSAVTPAWFEYDANFAWMLKRHSWPVLDSAAPDFSGSTPPSGNSVIQYVHEGGTGKVTQRTDAFATASARVTNYTYDVRGNLRTVQTPSSAAGTNTVATAATVITNQYDPKTGELKNTAYTGNAAPSVAYAYHRNGTVQTVTESGSQTRSYGYNFAGGSGDSLKMLTEDLPSYYSAIPALATNDSSHTANRIKNQYSSIGIYGLSAGAADGVSGGGSSLSATRSSTTWAWQSGLLNSATFEGTSATYSHEIGGFLQTRKTCGSLTESKSYEADRDLLKTTTSQAGGTTVSSHTFTHDNMGRRTSLLQGGSNYQGYGGNLFTDFGYDGRNRIVSAETKAGNSTASPALAGRLFGYGYDLANNRRSISRPGSPQGSSANPWSVNALNEIISLQNPQWSEVSGMVARYNGVALLPPGQATVFPKKTAQHFHSYYTPPTGSGLRKANIDIAVSRRAGGSLDTLTGKYKDALDRRTLALSMRPASEALKYDARSNLAEDAMWKYTWDGTDRLVGIESSADSIAANLPKVKLSFLYDFMGRRYMKRSHPWTGSAFAANPDKVTLFWWDGWMLLREASYAVTWGGSTPTAASFLRETRYSWGADIDGGGAGGLCGIVTREAGQAAAPILYPIFDGNGNVVSLVDPSGKTKAAYEYDPYGNILRATGEKAAVNPFRFATKYYDAETKLVYHHLRYYSPRLGRFLGRDPILEAGGENLHAYVGNNPVSRTDLNGMAISFYNSAGSGGGLSSYSSSTLGGGDGGGIFTYASTMPGYQDYNNYQQTVFSHRLASVEEQINALYARAEYSYNTYTQSPGGSGVPPDIARYESKYQAELAELLDGAEIDGPASKSEDDRLLRIYSFNARERTKAFAQLASLKDLPDRNEYSHQARILKLASAIIQTPENLAIIAGKGIMSPWSDAVQAFGGYDAYTGEKASRAEGAAMLGLGIVTGSLGEVAEEGMALRYLDEAGEVAAMEVKGVANTTARVETTALSTYRSTTAGETFIRYESANPAFSKFTTNGGLPSGSYAAPMSDGFIPVADRIGVYNLPSANIPRTSATIFSPPTGTPIIGPRPVIGGSGNEVLFPFGFKP